MAQLHTSRKQSSSHPSISPVAFLLQQQELAHRSSVNNKNLQQNQLPNVHLDAKEKIVCHQCGRCFRTLASLHQHSSDAHHGLNVVVNLTITRKRVSTLQPKLGDTSGLIDVVACSDCGKTFKTAQFLHQHHWDAAGHTRVSQTPTPNPRSECSQCSAKFRCAEELEQHFMESHPCDCCHSHQMTGTFLLMSGLKIRLLIACILHFIVVVLIPFAANNAVRAVSRSDDAETWDRVALRFARGWKHQKPLHGIHRIFKVYNEGKRTYGFEDYRKQLKTTTNALKGEHHGDPDLRRKVLENGNEELMFHGTRMKCGLPRERCCDDEGCSVCSIIRTGFKTSKARTGFQRFGTGIYVSATSSKANDYVKGMVELEEGGGGGQKVLLVCRVLAGVVYPSTRNLEQLRSAPAGFHSVQGVPGEHLNYDELVVYDDRAILPAFIITYSSD